MTEQPESITLNRKQGIAHQKQSTDFALTSSILFLKLDMHKAEPHVVGHPCLVLHKSFCTKECRMTSSWERKEDLEAKFVLLGVRGL